MRWPVCTVFIFSITIGLPCSTTKAQVVRTVALAAQHAPGTPDDVTFRDEPLSDNFTTPMLNSSGQTVFTALTVGSSFNGVGLWTEGSGSLGLVLHEVDPVPGIASGVNFADFITFAQTFWFNNSGQTAFTASLTGDGVDNTNNKGIWTGEAGSVSLVAREGDQAPGAPADIFFEEFEFGSLRLDSSGQVAFYADLTGSGVSGSTNDSGIWMGGPSSLDLVAQKGNQAPDLPAGVTFSGFNRNVGLSPAGTVAISGGLQGAGIIEGINDGGIWVGTAGDLSLKVRIGDQAPGLANGIVYRIARDIDLNSAGQIVFEGILTAIVAGTGFDPDRSRGIWSDNKGSLGLVALEGDPAPGTPAGVNFEFFASHWMNSAGDIIFSADLRGAGVGDEEDRGIWRERSGSLELLVRKGDQAPETSAGVYFSRFVQFGLNDASRAMFGGDLVGNDITAANDFGIWAEDQTGALKLIAREGDLLEVAPSDFRTINRLRFHSSNYSFNSQGQVSFLANFTDGTSGIFVSNLVAVPEPSNLLLGATAIFMGLVLRRHWSITARSF